MATTIIVNPSDVLAKMSRPQIGIGRLPVRRSANDPKEVMNCKSCRKRKIKCNRLKPSCEACQVFNCACIYDAVPKKRGPKTDVLEALLKRVNGLEKRLKDDGTPNPRENAEHEVLDQSKGQEEPSSKEITQQVPDEEPQAENRPKLLPAEPPVQVRQSVQNPESIAFTDALLDTYFARLQNKPYYVLDEANTRQRLRDGHLPRFMVHAIHAVSIIYVPHLCGGHSGALRSSQEHADQARSEIDVDTPSIDNLQALLLLAMANFQAGKGRKSYLLLSHAISMAFALDLHREVPEQLRFAAIEREGRRKLFWTCYLMDRFTASGSKRPTLISDESISLRYPAWLSQGSQQLVDGNYFPNGSSLPHASGVSSGAQGSAAMLVEAVQILGVANRYLAAGGVKGDSHFPWHVQSTLSRIRRDLDTWAANTQDAFTSVEALFGHADSVNLVLSKLVYHLVHCLIYRPFLPVDLAELSGNSQNQSWQIEATNLCFMHANAIAELVDIGKNTGIIYWPAFVGYCVCTAGTIHIHGAHYMALQEEDIFSHSTDFLSREMARLEDLSFTWAGVQHQRETLQIAYASHSRLVQSLACSPTRFSPVFQMEDFFDRYPGSYIDGAHVTFADIVVDSNPERRQSHRGLSPGGNHWTQYNDMRPHPIISSQYMTQNRTPSGSRPVKRRRTTNGSLYPYPTPTSESQPDPFEQQRAVAGSLIQQQTNGHTNDDADQQNNNSVNEHAQNPTLAQSVFSPSFAFSPSMENMVLRSSNELVANNGEDHQTPDGVDARHQRLHADEPEDDPFLSFLEQLAANDGSNGPNDLDDFLSAQDSGFVDDT